MKRQIKIVEILEKHQKNPKQKRISLSSFGKNKNGRGNIKSTKKKHLRINR